MRRLRRQRDLWHARLLHVRATRAELTVLGVAVLRDANSAPRLAALQLPRLCAQLLLETGDATPIAIAAG